MFTCRFRSKAAAVALISLTLAATQACTSTPGRPGPHATTPAPSTAQPAAAPHYEYFTSSADGIHWPAAPRRLWPGQGTLSLPEWWIGPAIKVSAAYGNAGIWPGDTFGISSLPGGRISLTWGSAVGASRFSAIYASVVKI